MSMNKLKLRQYKLIVDIIRHRLPSDGSLELFTIEMNMDSERKVPEKSIFTYNPFDIIILETLKGIVI